MMSPGEIPSCAARVPFLRALPADALVELSQHMRHVEYEPGTVVALAGEQVDQLIIVAHGRLQTVRTTAQGREQVTRVLRPGDFLGELALFTPSKHESDVIAMEPSTVCVLKRDAVQALLSTHPSVAAGLVEALARRLAQAETTIAELALHDVEGRLAAELLRLVPQDAAAEHDIRVQVPVPWTQIAGRLGTTPESVSRRLKALAARGLIVQERSRVIVIRDAGALRQLAES